MKILTSLLLLLLTSSVYSQEINDIFSALEAGDTEVLATYLHPRAEVHILQQKPAYDKASAVRALNKFFQSHTPTAYKKIHRGESKAQDSLYSIGHLETSEASFRVYLYVKRFSDGLKIEELRIDQE